MMYVQIYFMALVLLVLMYKYMLVMLMFLEVIIINVSVLIFLLFSLYKIEFYMIYYLVFSVCESVLGITLLVLIVRFSGNEYYSSTNMGKF